MTDDRLEQIVGNLLRTGVILAAAVVLAGGLWYLASHGEAAPQYQHFHPAVSGIRGVLSLPGPLAVIFAGLLILIATPVARVIFALAGFALERDGAYVAITAVVLIILLYSIGTAFVR